MMKGAVGWDSEQMLALKMVLALLLLALLLTHGVCTECSQITASESLHPTDRSVRKKTTSVKTRDVIVGMNNYVSNSLEDYMNDNMVPERPHPRSQPE